MGTNALYSRDLLYPTENVYEPGSVHIEVLNPNKSARIPVVIENKTAHSPIRYIDSIIRLMQSDIFDRVFVDIRKNTVLYIKADETLRKEYGKNYIRVTFDSDKTEYTAVDEIEF